MKTEINNIPELTALTEKLVFNSNELAESLDNLKSIVGKAKDYDGIDVTTSGNILKNNLNILSNDIKIAAKNMKGYSTGIENLNIDDFTTFFLSLDDKISEFIPEIISDYTAGIEKISKTIMMPFKNNDNNMKSTQEIEKDSLQYLDQNM